MTMMNVPIKDYEIRDTRGFFGMVQVAVGSFDIGGGAGQTTILLVEADKLQLNMISPVKSQLGFFGAVVYHVNDSLHLDLDAMQGGYKWYNGEHQKLNVISGGATLTF